ncbi:MAG: 50S ribosomal protein L24e [Candidatus Aenigmatarchaeota archaeon]|nr:MAG: 50S ribosomal protein L24e [Candidatus Aenigmarchaeota archaeon]
MDCTFCGETMQRGKGKIVVKKTGETSAYCSSKCEHNALLGRSARKIQWTRVSRVARGKEK